MKSYVSQGERPHYFPSEAERRRSSLQEAERTLVAFQQRHGSDRDLAKAHAMVELAILEIRKRREE
jgi:hypothetical protein